MENVIIYTDGGCDPNPGNGCWSFVVVNPYIETVGHAESETTSNRMEMIAVLKAAEFAAETFINKSIEIRSDSQYVVKGFNIWSLGWKNNNWTRREDGENVPVKNSDLWIELDKFRNKIKLVWVRGHNGDDFNEQCDQLVKAEYQKVFGGKMTY